MFKRQPKLRTRIDACRTVVRTLFGETEIIFEPERARVNGVVLKNAQTHALFDLERRMFDAPEGVFAQPLPCFDDKQRIHFEMFEQGILAWAEIGTRLFMRQCFAIVPSGSDMNGPWIIVQDGVY